MEHPGQHRADEEGEDGLLAHGREQLVEQARGAQGRGGLLDQRQRQQHQPQADEDAAHVVRAQLGRPGMDDIAREDEERRGPQREVGARGEDRGDDGGAHVRAQQHREAERRADGAGGGKARHDQRHRRAGAEDRGGDAARREGGEAVADAMLDEVLQPVAIGPHHAGAHHAHAPQQEGDTSQQVDDDGGAWVQLVLIGPAHCGHGSDHVFTLVKNFMASMTPSFTPLPESLIPPKGDISMR